MPEPTSTTSHIYSEQYIVRLTGKLADEHAISIDDAVTSLEGWESVLQIAVNSYQARRLLARPQLGSDLPRVIVQLRSIREGSIEFGLDWKLSIPSLVAGLLITPQTLRYVYLWVKALIDNHVTTKATISTDYAAAAAALATLAQQHGITVDDPAEAQVVLFAIDDAMEKATRPVQQSANRMELIRVNEGQREVMSVVVERDRESLASLYRHPEPLDEVSEWQLRTLQFTGQDIEDRKAKFYFVGANGAPEKTKRTGLIKDELFDRAFSPYAHAFAARTPISVWIQEHRPVGKRPYWVIRNHVSREALATLFQQPPTPPQLPTPASE